jgi:hypothetical protein
MREEIEIDGITFWVGQRWRENDKRFDRYVRVVGWNTETKRIQINGGRPTWASAKRFDGRSGGYVLA